ncbi:hypothetical protein LCGC14_0598500 [marine sediment metagenome]|uniref:Phage virion morphogenesis protein n=1 Tax=marine sediment metagenome TaxID=412755 RepID=A0A0F9RG79_9ZZZZ
MTVVEVKIRDHGTFAYLKGLSSRAKKIGPEEVFRLAKFGAKKLKESYIRAKIRKGKSYNQIEARKLTKKSSGIFIPQRLILLDRMPPHFVSLKQGRRITEWARRYFGTRTVTGMSEVRYGPKGGIKGAVFVTPHPFIDAGYRMMLNRLDIVANRIANRIVK